MTYITSVCSSDMENVQKKRALPMKTKINDIPIKRTPKTKVRPEDKPRLNEYLRQYFKANQNKQRLRCRQWAQNPRNKETRNVRQRLRRYKVKLNTQLINIWLQRGLITIQSASKVE